MCGIAGIHSYHYASSAIDRIELQRFTEHMNRRGPDGEGLWISDNEHIGLAHRRLSIIDLSDAAAQPMHSACGRYTITFNGEIYNYRDLADSLKAAGIQLRTQSDTEVILQLFARHAESMLELLRGMFALAIWDDQEQRLFLARDTFGIKPLYYADDGWTIRFASQVKALQTSDVISSEYETAAQAGFLLFGSIPEPFTVSRAIRALPAGHYLWVTETGVGVPQSHESWQDLLSTDDDESDSLQQAISDSVKAHLVSDVPVGAFLSAGIDSCLLVALMSQHASTPINTVTVGFDEFRDTDHDELPLARAVASQFNTRHHEVLISRADFDDVRDRILEDMDQPSIDGINSWLVSRAAAETGMKVAISGLGGDELFAGYPSFADVSRWHRWTRLPAMIPGLGRAVRALTAPLFSALGIHPKAAGLLEYGRDIPGLYLCKRGLFMPWELDGIMGCDAARDGLERLGLAVLLSGADATTSVVQTRISALESNLYMKNQLLRDTDWASMAHSLEVRVPLVDRHLVRAAMSARVTSKQTVARSFGDLLPEAVIRKPKTGFSTPVQSWLFPQQKRQSAFDSRFWGKDLSRCVFSH